MVENYLGTTVDDFMLESTDGQTITLSRLRGHKVLLYFFTSPGGGNWTRMALGYRDYAASFTEKNVVVFGVHDGSLESSREWIEKENLPFAVLNDPGRLLGISVGMSTIDGERYVRDPSEGRRPAVVIDEFGIICAWEPDMNDTAHIVDLLARL
jgi:peroxiredoxin Q/BCP